VADGIAGSGRSAKTVVDAQRRAIGPLVFAHSGEVRGATTYAGAVGW